MMMGENFDEAFGGLYMKYKIYMVNYTLSLFLQKFFFLFYILENVTFCTRTDTYIYACMGAGNIVIIIHN